MRSLRESAFTLVEVLMVVAILAVLAAIIIPQLSDSQVDGTAGAVEFNLHILRSQIELYKSQHDGKPPSGTLVELTTKTNRAGVVGKSNLSPYGPYLRELPSNPLTGSNRVKVITASPATAKDVTGKGGWLYNQTTGEIFVDHAKFFRE